MNKVRANVKDTVRITKSNTASIENGCEGIIVGVQLSADGEVVYTAKITVYPSNDAVETLCSLREGEFEVLEGEEKYYTLDEIFNNI